MQIAATSENAPLPRSGSMPTYLRLCAIMTDSQANADPVSLSGCAAVAGPEPLRPPVIFSQKNRSAAMCPGHRRNDD